MFPETQQNSENLVHILQDLFLYILWHWGAQVVWLRLDEHWMRMAVTRSEGRWATRLHQIVLARFNYIRHSHLTSPTLHHFTQVYIICHHNLLRIIPQSSVWWTTNILECMSWSNWPSRPNLLQCWFSIAMALLGHVSICHRNVGVLGSELVSSSLKKS